MELLFYWAGARFCTQNGAPEAFLTAAAQQGFALRQVSPCPGGFCAQCAAWRYRRLARLARRHHVRLRIQRRTGLYFALRPTLRRRGLWAGLGVFVPLLLWLQGFVWAIDATGLTTGQRARAAAVLWAQGLVPGRFVTQNELAAGEYALLQSGEFSWASLNFSRGRLVVEAAPATPVPVIVGGTMHGLRARVSGTVVSTSLVSGTMLVTPGQEVEAGQGLIGTARAERDGTLIFQPAAGSVRAQFEWEHLQSEPLLLTVSLPQQGVCRRWRILFGGRSVALPSLLPQPADAQTVVRHFQPELWGLTLPFSVEETNCYPLQTTKLVYTEEQALALARMHSRAALYADYPDAELVARKEDLSLEDQTLHYRVRCTVIAEICGQNN